MLSGEDRGEEDKFAVAHEKAGNVILGG